jgi:hypothetical protein
LGLAGGRGAYAGDAKKGTQEGTFKGEIVSVNPPANEFTVRSKKDGKLREMTFSVERPVGITRRSGHLGDRRRPSSALGLRSRSTVGCRPQRSS